MSHISRIFTNTDDDNIEDERITSDNDEIIMFISRDDQDLWVVM